MLYLSETDLIHFIILFPVVPIFLQMKNIPCAHLMHSLHRPLWMDFQAGAISYLLREVLE